MTDLIFGIIILALIAVIVFLLKLYHEQERRLIKAMLSKDLKEFSDSEIADKPVKKSKGVEDDFVSMSEVDDEQFSKLIKQQVEK